MVPTYRRPDDLRRCLQGLLAQSEAPDEVVVVARPDDEASERVHADFAGLARLVPTGAGGQVAALVAGSRATTAGVVAFVDDDAVPRPEWVARLRAHFSDPGVVAVGGRDVVHHPGGIEEGAEPVVGVLTRWGKPVGHHHLGVGGPRPVQILKGCNSAYRRGVLGIPVGLRGAGAQPMNDLATSLRASTFGTVVYDPDVVVDHHPAERFDDDGREVKTTGALLDMVWNQALSVGSLAPGLRRRYRLFYLLVGDAVTPGVLRAAVARARREPFSSGRLLATQATMAAALAASRRQPLRFELVGATPPVPA